MAHGHKTGGDAPEEPRAGSHTKRWSLADLFIKPKPTSHDPRRSHSTKSKHGSHGSKPKHSSHSSKPKHSSHDDNRKRSSHSSKSKRSSRDGKPKHSSHGSKPKHSSHSKEAKAVRSATTASASPKEHSRKKRPTLVRRRTSPDTSTRKAGGESAAVTPDRPKGHSHRRRSSLPQPDQIHVDVRDSSDAWTRMPTKSKPSRSSDRSHSLFQGVSMPHFLGVLCGQEKPSKPPSKPQKRKKARSRHSSKHRTHRKDSVADKADKAAVQMPMPEAPANVGADTSGSQTVHFSHPPDSLAQDSNAVRMPTPVHFVGDGMPYAPTATDPGNPQDSSGDPSQAYASTSRRNRVSTASGDEDGQPQVFQVLGRRNTQRSRHTAKTSDAISPVLVTIARDGSIVSDLASRQSEDQSGRTPQTNSEMSGSASATGQAVTRLGTRKLTPSTSPAAADVSASIGTGSFVTAQMPPSARPSEGPFKQVRRQSDEVSDIDMRRHLLIGDDQTSAGDPQSPRRVSESQLGEDRALDEWLHGQATDHLRQSCQPRHQSIAQTILQGPALPERTIPPTNAPVADSPAAPSGRGKPLSGEESPRQMLYFPSTELQSRLSRAADNKEAGVFEQLLARVTDLESQFTCMEAVMVSIEEKLTRITSSPSQSLSIRRPSKPRSSAGMTPELRGVSVSDSKRSPEQEKLSGHDGCEDPAIAAQSAADTLAEIVNRSRHGFNATTSNALSSIASLVKDIKMLDQTYKTPDSDNRQSG
ncbi:hypothetical protein H4R20_003582 [Coemansia guatemalensis]|uniref:Uncharacterized protein n=1 Tax=Coemansia guatemalensis TaxID=2761395 RepID=A0A9W8LR96_9FUNG|nr:hypothetical protein H4R20_003582 [Coemansia guatemalensis]